MEVTPKLMQTIREEMRHGRGDNLTIPQFRVLAAVNRGLIHNKEICELLGVSEAAISRMIDGLVKDGFLKKKTNELDKRQTLLSLTSSGKKYFKNVKLDARNKLKEKWKTLTEEELLMVINCLEIFKKKLGHI
jgi:DNA-binding MarR family transcriptional regulator